MKTFLFLNLLTYFKFIVGGCISLLFNLVLTNVLIVQFEIWHMISYGISLSLEIVFLFFYHSLITFKIYGKIVNFLLNIVFISLLNWLGVLFLSTSLELNYNLSIILIAGLLSIVNYSISKHLVFIK